MNLGLENKTVLISGSSRGIGRAIAESFLREGARVIISGRNQKDLDRFVTDNEKNRSKIQTFCGDLMHEIDIEKCVAGATRAFGPIDCVVPNIGKGAVRFGHEIESKDWEETFAINLWGAVRLVEKTLPILKKNGGGSIVFVAALAGMEAVAAPLTYCTAKAALIAYAKNLSREVAIHSIRVNCVAPGNIIFPGGRWEEKLREDRDKFTAYIAENVAMKRFGKPEEIADFVAFMSSNRASFLTGECICIDGGQRRGF